MVRIRAGLIASDIFFGEGPGNQGYTGKKKTKKKNKTHKNKINNGSLLQGKSSFLWNFTFLTTVQNILSVGSRTRRRSRNPVGPGLGCGNVENVKKNSLQKNS